MLATLSHSQPDPKAKLIPIIYLTVVKNLLTSLEVIFDFLAEEINSLDNQK